MDSGYIQTRIEESHQSCQNSFPGKVIVCFLLFANIYDMGGSFGIKYASFALAILYLALNFRSLPMDRPTNHIFLYIFLLWPLLSLLIGVLSGADIALALSQITPFLAAIVFLLVIQSVCPEYAFSAFFGVMYSLAIVVIVIYALMRGNHPAADYLLLIFASDTHGYIGFRPFGDILLPNIYFKATLFFVPTYVYFFYKGELIKALLVLLALVLAFSKMGFAICILFTFFYLFFKKTKMYFKVAIVTVFLLMLPGFLSFEQFTEELIQSFSGQSETSQVRIGYIEPLIKLFDDAPFSLLIGQGAGSTFYAQNMGGFVSNLEVDYLNAIRKFGLPWFLVFSAFVFILTRKLFNSNLADGKIISLSLLVIFIAAGTNPVLISPPFLMFMAMSLDLYWRGNESVN